MAESIQMRDKRFTSLAVLITVLLAMAVFLMPLAAVAESMPEGGA